MGWYSRIDRFYVSDSLQNYVTSTTITPPILSDHSVVCLHIKYTSEGLTGPNFWRLNNDLLFDENYVSHIKKLIEKSASEQTEGQTWQTRYDFLKFQIKEHSIKISKQAAKKNREEVKALEDSIIILDSKLQMRPLDEHLKKLLIEAQTKLDGHYTRIERGQALQAKIQCYEEGEKSSKFFLNQAKQNNRKCTIRQLKIGEGDQKKVITNPKEILNEIERFYTDLYTSNHTAESITKIDEWIEDLNRQNLIPKISRENSLKLETGITRERISRTIKGLGKNKTPGSDGLTYEFYQKFWPELQDIFMLQLYEGIERGELTTSQKQNVIRLIPKKDKDKTLIKNWRPLTLGQGDAKIDSKTLADMMIEVMADLIHPNQIAYIKKRFIGEGIRLIDGIIDYIKEKQLSGYMFAIDFLKAFDSYEWEFWVRVLRVFGFPEPFILLIKRHYKNINSCVVNSGTSTNYFPIKRGIKQGDPPSGLIFILGIELFAIKVRANKMIQGIEVNRLEIKLSAYADDVLNFLRNIQSVKNILVELEKFGEISGLVCNLSKCEAMALGESKQERITYNNVKIEWVEKMKITGITFGNKSDENRKEDVEEAISKMQTQLQIWSGRNLSILGKIQIVKTFGISQILYISNMLPLKTEEIRKIDKIISNFIWNYKPAKIKKAAMVAEYAHGGLKFPNIEAQINAQKIMWVKRYLCSPDHPWKLIFEWQIEKIGGLDFLRYTNLNVQFIEIIKKQEGLTEFYADLFTAWAEYNKCDISVDNVLDQNLFFQS